MGPALVLAQEQRLVHGVMNRVYGVVNSSAEAKELFNRIDGDQSGSVDANELGFRKRLVA